MEAVRLGKKGPQFGIRLRKKKEEEKEDRREPRGTNQGRAAGNCNRDPRGYPRPPFTTLGRQKKVTEKIRCDRPLSRGPKSKKKKS